MHVKTSEAPRFVQDIVGNIRAVELIPHATPEVGGSWHDANRTTVVFFDGNRVTDRLQGTYGESAINATRRELAANLGGRVALPNEAAGVVQIDTFPKPHARVWLHPNHPIFKALPSGDVLTLAEKAVLVATGLKNTYNGETNVRAKECVREGLCTFEEYEAAKAALIARGLLAKNGAITLEGKNAHPASLQLHNLKGRA